MVSDAPPTTSQVTDELIRSLEKSVHPIVVKDVKFKTRPATGQIQEHEHPMWNKGKK